MKIGLLLTLALGLIVSGCATSSTDSSSSTQTAAAEEAEKQLQVGMTKDQVIQLFGTTDRISQTTQGEVWTYHHNFGEQFIPYNFGYRPKISTITFDKEGKLVEFNRMK